jgi:hypothetical protein
MRVCLHFGGEGRNGTEIAAVAGRAGPALAPQTGPLRLGTLLVWSIAEQIGIARSWRESSFSFSAKGDVHNPCAAFLAGVKNNPKIAFHTR